MSVHRSTFLSTKINSSRGISSNTWVLQYQMMDPNNTSIASRVAQAKKRLQRMKSVLTNKHLHSYKKNSPGVLFGPILVNGFEAWIISKVWGEKNEDNRNVVPTENAQISWTAKISKETMC